MFRRQKRILDVTRTQSYIVLGQFVQRLQEREFCLCSLFKNDSELLRVKGHDLAREADRGMW